MCQMWDLEEVLLFTNVSTANSQNSLQTVPTVLCAAPGFAFDLLGSGRINDAADLSKLLGGREDTEDGGRPIIEGVK